MIPYLYSESKSIVKTLSFVVKAEIMSDKSKLPIKHITFAVRYTLLKFKAGPFTLDLKVDVQNFVINII